MRELLHYINKKKSFDLISYNKSFQRRIGINIEYYKNEARKIKTGERNGYGKEYKLYNNILVFEGEYLNGKKNGKGKEFYENGSIKFEGEYLKGRIIEGKGYDIEGNEVLIIEKNGKGKEIYFDSNIQFEGEYLNGKRWKGKGYNIEGKKNLK